MRWDNVVVGDKTYSLEHLQPFRTMVQVGKREIELIVSFGFHVFTDEKGKGPLLVNRHEQRYFCPIRCEDSHQATHFLQTRMEDAYARPYLASRQQQFFVMDIQDYAMFLSIQKPDQSVNTLKCHLVSAYAVDTWGRPSLPTRAKLQKMTYVLDRREQGLKIPL